MRICCLDFKKPCESLGSACGGIGARGHPTKQETAECEVLRTPPADLARHKLQHVYDWAKVCRSKYRAIVTAFTFGAVGAGTAILYLLISS